MMVSRTARSAIFRDFARLVSKAQVEELASIGHDLLEVERDGATVTDARGRRYVDCVSSAGIFNLGRRRAELVDELRRAMHETDQGNFPMISEEKATLARDLTRFAGHGLVGAVFSVVRGESFDFACKLARGVTARKGLLAIEGSWFGQTGFAMSLSTRADRARFEPLVPETGFLPFGDLAAAARTIGRGTAAVFVEPVQAESGCRVLNADYLRGLRKITRRAGALLVVDETQTGLGRTGRRFAFEHAGIEPDVVIVGEALGGGIFPIAATLFTERVASFMHAHPLIHLSTFGGSDLGCRVALRALTLYRTEEPWINAAARGNELRRGIARAIEDRPGVGGYSGQGLLFALDLGTGERARDFCRHLAAAGVLALPGAAEPRTVVFRPSLTLAAAEVGAIEMAIECAAEALD